MSFYQFPPFGGGCTVVGVFLAGSSLQNILPLVKLPDKDKVKEKYSKSNSKSAEGQNRIEQGQLSFPNLLLNTLAQNCFVELEGFEPSSKQGTNWLSTCLSILDFRTWAGGKRPT